MSDGGPGGQRHRHAERVALDATAADELAVHRQALQRARDRHGGDADLASRASVDVSGPGEDVPTPVQPVGPAPLRADPAADPVVGLRAPACPSAAAASRPTARRARHRRRPRPSCRPCLPGPLGLDPQVAERLGAADQDLVLRDLLGPDAAVVLHVDRAVEHDGLAGAAHALAARRRPAAVPAARAASRTYWSGRTGDRAAAADELDAEGRHAGVGRRRRGVARLVGPGAADRRRPARSAGRLSKEKLSSW